MLEALERLGSTHNNTEVSSLQYLMVCAVVRQVHVPIQVVNLYVIMVVRLQTLSARFASVATRSLRLNKSCWVAEVWHVKRQGGLCCAHIFGVLHIHTWCMCVVLTELDAELHSQKESHFGWLC